MKRVYIYLGTLAESDAWREKNAIARSDTNVLPPTAKEEEVLSMLAGYHGVILTVVLRDKWWMTRAIQPLVELMRSMTAIGENVEAILDIGVLP